jgi:molybdopterin/thiamine biosynthesis adenylyltransferase
VSVDLRVDGATWRAVSDHLANEQDEQAAALLVRSRPEGDDPVALVVERWRPVTDAYVRDRTHGLTWDGRFNMRVADEAEREGLGVVFIHRHGGASTPRLSGIDRDRGQALLRFLRRRCPDATHGLLVIGDGGIAGWIQTSSGRRRWAEVRSAGPPPVILPARVGTFGDAADRQLLAFGTAGMEAVAACRVGVVGLSGGGSHVAQQLIHAGVGTLVAVDGQLVDETNLRRLVGARRRDIDRTLKVRVARRLAQDVRPEVKVRAIAEEFPSARSLEALRTVDILIGCVDGWDVRDDLNSFALEHRIPYIDIGAVITPATEGRGVRVSGQIAVVLPGGPCLRCMGILTDARVSAARSRRQGYLGGAPEPQVVSVNGSLASEAVTAALMLIAGAVTFTPRRRYIYPPGLLLEVNASPLRSCPACRHAGLRSS